MRKSLTFANNVGYGMGAFTENCVQNGVIMMVMFIMYNHMGVSMVKLGYIFGLSRLWDAISDPLMGYISDNTRSRFGKRKPYLVFGAVMTALAYIGMWLFPEGKSEMWYFYYLTIFLLLYFTATTIFCVPYIAMGLEMSSDYHGRTRLMGYRSLFVNLSALLAPWMPKFTTLRCFENPLEGMRWLSLICGAVYILFALGPTVLTPTFSSRPEDGDGVAANPAAVARVGAKDILAAFAVRPFLLLALTLGLTVFGLFLIATTGYNYLLPRSVQQAGGLTGAGYRGPAELLWIGNEEEGLNFSYDVNPFRSRDKRRQIKIRQGGGKDGGGALVLNLVDAAGQLDGDEAVFRFFLHPTPTKPYPQRPVRDWIAWEWENWSRWHGYPDLSKIDEIKKRVSELARKNIALTLYCCQGLREDAPVMEAHRQDLEMLPRWRYYVHQGRNCFATCKRGPEGDLQLDHYAKIIGETGIRGLMSDGLTNPWGCANPLHRHGCGRPVKVDFNNDTMSLVVKQRQFLKRIHGIFRLPKSRIRSLTMGPRRSLEISRRLCSNAMK